jgi:hypothetical protein
MMYSFRALGTPHSYEEELPRSRFNGDVLDIEGIPPVVSREQEVRPVHVSPVFLLLYPSRNDSLGFILQEV